MRSATLVILVALLAMPSIAGAQCSTADGNGDNVPDVCPAGTNYIEGTAAGETLRGTNGADCIFGLGGDDTIRGRGGDDYICAGDGADEVIGAGGDDLIFGEGGDDTLGGGADNDFIDGGAGNDELNGVGGADTLNGGTGNDQLNGGSGADALSGEDGDDILEGSGGDDSLSGGDGIDTLNGGGGTNTCVEEVPGTADRLTNCDTITYASIGRFEVIQSSGGRIVAWNTTSEVGTVAFRLWRVQADGALAWVDEISAAADGSPHGARYFVRDQAASDDPVQYILEERSVSGGSVQYGPFLRSALPPDSSDTFLESGVSQGRLANRVEVHRQLRPLPALEPQSLGRKSDEPPTALVLLVDQSGVVEVGAESVAIGLRMDTDAIRDLFASAGVELSLRGAPVAWHPVERGTAIRFVAPEIRSPFSRHHRYLLSIGDGLLMDSALLIPAPASDPHQFTDTKRFEENVFPGPTGGPNPRKDLFFWHGLGSEAQASIAVSLPALSGSSAEELRVIVQGATEHPEQPHRVELHWNGQSLGVFDVFGRTRHTITVPLQGVNAALENQLIVQQHVAGEAPPSLFIDAVEVDYVRFAMADGPVFEFGAADDGAQSVSGLSSETVYLYDLSDPSAASYYGPATASDSGELSFATEETALRFLAASPESIQSPTEISPRFASNLRSTEHSVDYLIIAASHLLTDAQALADYREADGYRVLLVDIEDVYWEFADGEPDPIAIRDFLRFAHQNWESGPRFATLVGKGSLDYRDLQGLGGNWVPPALAMTDGGLFPSDSLLADVVGYDAIPDIAIGRLPISSGEELDRILAAIQAFEAEHESMGTLFAADDSEHGEFGDAARNLSAWTSAERLHEIDLNSESLEEARARLFSIWGESLSWLNYVGHGGLDRMGDEGWLTSEDVPALVDLESRPVVLGWSCNLLRFDIPGFISIGEALLASGSIAGVFSSTGWSNHVDTDALRTALTEAALASDAETLGEAMLRGHRAAAGVPAELHRVYMLLGDPALRLRQAKSEPDPEPNPPPSERPDLPNPDPGASPSSSSGCEIKAPVDAGGPLWPAAALIVLAMTIRRRRA